MRSQIYTPRRKAAEGLAATFVAHLYFIAPLRLGLSVLLFISLPKLCAPAAEINPVKIALLVDGMAGRGSGYDAAELHALGTDGLAAVLDHLLPDTAPPARPIQPAPPEHEVRRLIARLDADDFTSRERATHELIARARARRPLLEEAARSDSLEVRLRAERVLASWESRPTERLSAYLSGFWSYIEGIEDQPRLELLARRTAKAFEQGMPEGDRLHLLRLCIAGVAHGRNDESCEILRPLIDHGDARIATLITETVGAYKTESRFVPQLLVDALRSDRPAVVEAALRFVLGGQDEKRRTALHAALQSILAKGAEPLRFQACLPLIRDFQDADAWIYVLEQTTSSDANRVRTALNWISDTKNCGQPPDSRLLNRLERSLAGRTSEQRRVAVQILGRFAGQSVVRRLIDLLSDSDENVVRQVDASLLTQPDRELVQRLLSESATVDRDAASRLRIQALLGKLQRL